MFLPAFAWVSRTFGAFFTIVYQRLFVCMHLSRFAVVITELLLYLKYTGSHFEWMVLSARNEILAPNANTLPPNPKHNLLHIPNT